MMIIDRSILCHSRGLAWPCGQTPRRHVEGARTPQFEAFDGAALQETAVVENGRTVKIRSRWNQVPAFEWTSRKVGLRLEMAFQTKTHQPQLSRVLTEFFSEVSNRKKPGNATETELSEFATLVDGFKFFSSSRLDPLNFFFFGGSFVGAAIKSMRCFRSNFEVRFRCFGD